MKVNIKIKNIGDAIRFANVVSAEYKKFRLYDKNDSNGFYADSFLVLTYHLNKTLELRPTAGSISESEWQSLLQKISFCIVR
jgi:hypothetical protein